MKNTNSAKRSIKIGITGSTGAVGSRLIEMLINDDLVEIFCLIRKSSRIDKQMLKLATPVYGDLSCTESLEEFVANLDVCVHLAAQVAYTSKNDFHKSNVVGTENLCKAIVKANPKCKFINCSSVAAYRMTGLCQMQYTDYAKSKKSAEKVVDHYANNHNLKAVTIIPGMIYGPGKNNLIPTIHNYLKKENFFFISGGEKFAPLSYIDDLCNLFIKAIYNDKAIGNKYFGFRSEEQEGFHDFVRYIAKRTACKTPNKTLPKNLMMPIAIANEMAHSALRSKKTLKVSKRLVDILSINYPLENEQKMNNLNWASKTTMKEGLDNTIKWLKERQRLY